MLGNPSYYHHHITVINIIFRLAKAGAGPVERSVKEQTKALNEQVSTFTHKSSFASYVYMEPGVV